MQPRHFSDSQIDTSAPKAKSLLFLQDLSVAFPGPLPGTRETVVDNVSFEVRSNDFLGIVGESGSGKTMTALSIMRLLPSQAIIERGKIWFEGIELLGAPEDELRHVRGSKISMIFQSPRSSLNPVMKIGKQLSRAYGLRLGVAEREAWEKSLELLRIVGIRNPDRIMRSYPHQLSGGMCQRVVISMMVACHPRILIADEPTTALDVTIQAQIFDLLRMLREQIGMAVILITHDLGVIAETCSRVAVMYRGQLMEFGGVDQIFAKPRHPYTQYLLSSVLRIDREPDWASAETGGSQQPYRVSAGCRFAGRCPRAMPQCWTARPAIHVPSEGVQVACHLYQ